LDSKKERQKEYNRSGKVAEDFFAQFNTSSR